MLGRLRKTSNLRRERSPSRMPTMSPRVMSSRIARCNVDSSAPVAAVAFTLSQFAMQRGGVAAPVREPHPQRGIDPETLR